MHFSVKYSTFSPLKPSGYTMVCRLDPDLTTPPRILPIPPPCILLPVLLVLLLLLYISGVYRVGRGPSRFRRKEGCLSLPGFEGKETMYLVPTTQQVIRATIKYTYFICIIIRYTKQRAATKVRVV